MQNFIPTQLMIDAAHTVFVAMAWEQTIRPVVEGYQTKILQERQWPVKEQWAAREGKFVTNIDSIYLMSEQDVEKFAQRCNEECAKAKLQVAHAYLCPLLVAKSNLMDAKFALAAIMEPVTKISEESLRGALAETYNQYFELTLRLLAPFVKTDSELTT